MTETLPLPELASVGLLLQAAVPVGALDADVVETLERAVPRLTRKYSLVLLGQAGSRLWEQVSRHLDLRDPFDQTVERLVSEWFEENQPQAHWAVVSPGPAMLPLGRLAEQVGWGSPSPLGLTINATYGLWIAHRIAFVTDCGFPATKASAAEHPCDTCAGRPCETACPVAAVSYENGFDIGACSTHRIADKSTCALQCHARDACPVGTSYRYPPDQMRHHYGAGLASIRRLAE